MTPEIRAVKRLLRGVEGRVRGIVTRGVLGVLNFGGQGQTGQINGRAQDVDDDVEIFEQFGFRSSPPPGSEGIVLRVGGAREHAIGILFGSRATAPQGILQGEVAVYNSSGAQIVIRTDGSIEVTPAPGQVVKLGEVVGGLAVARQTDPVNCPDIAAIAAACTAFMAPAPDGGAALATAIAGAVTQGGNGTITAGGAGSVST